MTLAEMILGTDRARKVKIFLGLWNDLNFPVVIETQSVHQWSKKPKGLSYVHFELGYQSSNLFTLLDMTFISQILPRWYSSTTLSPANLGLATFNPS